MRKIRVHHAIKKDIERLYEDTKRELAQLFDLLLAGESLAMPVSRPMPVVAHGVHELRLRDRSGQLMVFYFTK